MALIFTFHYVSINIAADGLEAGTDFEFTFHYVSINI